MKLIFMDAGSGAKIPITTGMIEKVSSHIEAPLIVGGGITDPEKAYLNCRSGADIIVVGNAIEKDASLIKEISDAIHTAAVTVQQKSA
jgi:putative glycerol-1-phosphate prenyltransferase